MKLVLVSKQKSVLQAVSDVVRTFDEPPQLITVEGGIDRVTSLHGPQEPDVLILDSGVDGVEDIDKIERLGQQHPNVGFIVMTEKQTPEFLLKAMRAGVREVLPPPVSGPALAAALGRATRKANHRPARRGQILAFIGCKGGSGGTFLAANLAYALADGEKDKKVILIDINRNFGDAVLFVSEGRPTVTLSDAAAQIQRVDASFLARSLVEVLPNFGILAAPEDPARALEVKAEHVDTLLSLARSQYDYVVLDVGHTLDAVSIRALDLADSIFPVLQTTLPFIRDTKRLISMFRSLDYRNGKIQVVVNRWEKGGDINLKDVERSLGTKVAHTIPNNYQSVAASVNQGVPILRLARNCNVSKAIHEMGRSLADREESAQSGWLSRMLHHH